MPRVSSRYMRTLRLASHYTGYQNVFHPLASKDTPVPTFVPGEGDVMSGVVLIGEAPGEEEDRQGRPFVGRSGNLLAKVLKSISVHRSEVWMTNLLKYRPPDNRDPLPDEVSAASAMMRFELNILKPSIVVPIGRFACQLWYPNPRMDGLSGTNRTKIVGDATAQIIPMFHPSAGLRRAYVRERMFEDIKILKTALDTKER